MCEKTFIKDDQTIKCLECGFTSFNDNDINFEYCGNCKCFHDVLALKKIARECKQQKKLERSLGYRSKKFIGNWLKRLSSWRKNTTPKTSQRRRRF